jgi:hypothetical protein
MNKENEMLKNIFKGLVVAGALMAFAIPGTSNADIREINIFGASAQYKYWTEGAPQFLSDAMDCADGDIGHASTEDAGPDADRDAGIAICDSDSETDGVDLTPGGNNAGARATGYVGDTIIIRYTTFASAEGVYAGLGTNPSNTDSTCATGERLMADETTTTWSGIGTIPAPDGGVTSLKCEDINLGTSDIDPQCFTQNTYGPVKYSTFGTPGTLQSWMDAAGSVFGSFDKTTCRDCDSWWVREFSPITVDPAAYDVFNPIVVPFSFFVHESSLGSTVTNLTRPQAQMLFSQQVTNWNLFDGFPNQDVVVCLRHAGSGTHATLDWAVVRPFALAQFAYHPDESGVQSGTYPPTYTNKGSSDEVGCVAQYAGAVGYADSDKKGDSTDPCESGVCRTDYQGYTGNRANIKTGLYDFWGANFVVATAADAAKPEVVDLMAYMEDPSNLDATGKFEWWASQGEMLVDRSSCKFGIKKK